MHLFANIVVYQLEQILKFIYSIANFFHNQYFDQLKLDIFLLIFIDGNRLSNFLQVFIDLPKILKFGLFSISHIFCHISAQPSCVLCYGRQKAPYKAKSLQKMIFSLMRALGGLRFLK